jgi:hypothetical protein
MAAKRDPAVESLVKRVLSDFASDSKEWDRHCDLFASRYRAYRGVLDGGKEAVSEITGAKLQHPAVILSSLETMVSNLIDPSPKWRLRARPVVASQEEVQRLTKGARANELLLNYQIGCDHWAEKQRAFDLQGLICGLTVSKQRWDYREGDVRYQESYSEPVYDEFGSVIHQIPRLRDATRPSHVLRDEPTAEVVDVFDFVPHALRPSLENCDRVHHVVWYTKAQLLEMEANGRYGVRAGGEPISRLDDATGPTPTRPNRGDLFEQTRPKDMIRVVECWIDRGRRVVSIAGQDTLIEDRANPYWFDYLDHRFPFVTCSGMPDPFRIAGISEVELMAELQEMLWTLMNTRLDSTLLLSNPIFMIADDIEDPDAWSFEPGARNLVPRPVQETVKQWTPDPQVPQMTLQSESLVRSDIMDIVGGLPSGSQVQSQLAQSQTATGVSILVSLAQKRLAAKKQQFVWAKGRIGEQWCALNQQFVKEERLVPVIGAEGAQDWVAVRPEEIQGVYAFETEMVDDSLIRQERRAEQQAKLQVALQGAQVSAMAGAPINLKVFWEDYLGTFDVSDTERYFSATNPHPLAQQPQPGQPGQNGGGPGGVTNPDPRRGPHQPLERRVHESGNADAAGRGDGRRSGQCRIGSARRSPGSTRPTSATRRLRATRPVHRMASPPRALRSADRKAETGLGEHAVQRRIPRPGRRRVPRRILRRRTSRPRHPLTGPRHG